MKRQRKALTLIEIIIGVLICAILLTVIMKLLSSGVKGSSKGMAHQANMEVASIIMSQIEYDLLRSSSIESPACNETDNIAKWNFYYGASGSGSPVSVAYSVNYSGGVDRVVDINGKNQTMNLGKGHDVSLKFTHFKATPVPSDYFELGSKYFCKHAMWVELTVSTKHNKKVGTNESISLARLIVVKG